MFYPGVSIITLSVSDVARSRAFYERVGWRCSGQASSDECAFFQLNGLALALYDRRMFDAERGAAPSRNGGASLTALAQNHASSSCVDEAQRDFIEAGGTIVKAGNATHWGGYTSIVADPDGHLWELAWNPAFTLKPDGKIELPL
ncbi:MAG: VOC family protein [Beijerinckiaceae bacterium]|nr:VOC family protein [Beijerinckiaceae bacterium]